MCVNGQILDSANVGQGQFDDKRNKKLETAAKDWSAIWSRVVIGKIGLE